MKKEEMERGRGREEDEEGRGRKRRKREEVAKREVEGRRCNSTLRTLGPKEQFPFHLAPSQTPQ